MWYVIKREVVEIETGKKNEKIKLKISKREISGKEKIIIETCYFIMKYIFQWNYKKMVKYKFARQRNDMLYVNLKMIELYIIKSISKRILKANEYLNVERGLMILWKAAKPWLDQLIIEGWQEIEITDHLAIK